MHEMYTLYIDESGKSYFRKIDPSRPHFAIAGVVTKDDQDARKIRELADQIKYKYWDRTDIILHTTDLLHLDKIFWRFNPKAKNPAKLPIEDFYADLVKLIITMDFYLALVCINKSKFLALPENAVLALAVKEVESSPIKVPSYDPRLIRIIAAEKNLVKSHTHKMLIMYLHLLMRENARGRIVVEATGDPQDLHIFSAYNTLLSFGYAPFNMKGEDIRKYFTSISFATKNNHDTEIQLADMAAYLLNSQERRNDGYPDTSTYRKEHDDIVAAFQGKAFGYEDDLTRTTHSSLHRHC
jgi:hypothetical protein